VSYFDAVTGKRLVFLTNNFALPALTIAQIYKQRWQVELFDRWITKHLRIKAFYETSENAVKTQIWIASLSMCSSPSSANGSKSRVASTKSYSSQPNSIREKAHFTGTSGIQL
jgi:IS4 transposase